MSDDYQKDRKDRFAAEVQREGFADLHERQKATFEVQQDQNDHWNHGHLSHQSLPRLKFYVTLTDPALGPFISDAQQKVKRAYLAGTRFWHHHYSIDIADVVIDLNGRTCNIRIAPIDSFNYEFVTSGFPVVKSTLIQESIAFDTYNAVGINGKVILQNNLMTVTSQVTKQKRSTTGAVSTIERPFQIELLHEPANNPNGVQAFNRWRYRDSLFRSFAPYTPHSGLLVRSTLAHYRTFQLNNSIGPGHVHYTRDSYLDVPYQRADRSNPITSAYVRGAADWPRSNGVQTVHSPFGVREFVIYVDANGTFNVFPTGAITTPSGYTQNVPDDHVQRITPTWPAWMYTPSVKHKDYVLGDPDSQHLLVDLPDWEWKFNHLGTKAAAIVYERSAYSYDTTFWSTDVNIHQPFTSTKFDDLAADMGVHVLLQGASADSHSPQVYFNAPGIIEATVDITLTGGALKDFTATVTLREVRRPTTSTTTAVPAYVGYVWYDIPGGGQKADSTPITAKAGDFVVVDMELWVQPIGATGGSTKRFVLMSVKDLEHRPRDYEHGGAAGYQLRPHHVVVRDQARSLRVRAAEPHAACRRSACRHQLLAQPIRDMGDPQRQVERGAVPEFAHAAAEGHAQRAHPTVRPGAACAADDRYDKRRGVGNDATHHTEGWLDRRLDQQLPQLLGIPETLLVQRLVGVRRSRLPVQRHQLSHTGIRPVQGQRCRTGLPGRRRRDSAMA
jgi:hypothetical protein